MYLTLNINVWIGDTAKENKVHFTGNMLRGAAVRISF
jgi:hypothetical protein